MVFHELQQRFDCFFAIRISPVNSTLCQTVSFIDKKHTTKGPFDDIMDLYGGLTKILGHKTRPICLNYMSFR